MVLTKLEKNVLLIDNHTPNQSGFPDPPWAHNNEAMTPGAYSLNQCFGVVETWPKQADKSATMHNANLSSASRSVRKIIQKTRLKITKR